MVFKYHQNWVQIPQFRSAIVMETLENISHSGTQEKYTQRIEKLHLHMESLHFYLGRTSIR